MRTKPGRPLGAEGNRASIGRPDMTDGSKLANADLGASTREKILETAEPLFARLGFAGVGLREVADRVGIGKSSLFHHFENKIELYMAVHERVLNAFDA